MLAKVNQVDQETKLTKETDKGLTFLSGKKLPKDHPKLEVLGSLDELSSFLGLAASFSQGRKIKKEIELLQVKIFEIGKDLIEKKKNLKKDQAALLEEKIKDFEKGLPKLEKFILPGGDRAASALHVCRSLARRAERRLVTLSKKEKVNPHLLAYLNRLSSYLFILSRFVNFKKGKKEKLWL